jgi:peptidoglycan/LPS O-acetylase OafA/YrhL
LVQAAAFLVVIGLSIPSYVVYVLHPLSCTADLECLDLRGLEFVASVFFLGPPTVLLLAAYWLWRRPRRWPAVLPILADVAIIGVVFDDLVNYTKSGSAHPDIGLQILVGLLPAVVSLALVLALVRRQWPTSGG